MVRITTLILLISTIGWTTAANFNTPPFPSFNFPKGDPSHQSGFHTGTLHCVRSPADCACPTTYFPPNGCHHCPCASGTQKGPSAVSTSLPTTPVSPGPSVPTAMTTRTSVPVTSQVTSSVTNYCHIAKNLCRKNCPDGYLVDPDDCTFCLCKNDLIAG